MAGEMQTRPIMSRLVASFGPVGREVFKEAKVEDCEWMWTPGKGPAKIRVSIVTDDDVKNWRNLLKFVDCVRKKHPVYIMEKSGGTEPATIFAGRVADAKFRVVRRSRGHFIKREGRYELTLAEQDGDSLKLP